MSPFPRLILLWVLPALATLVTPAVKAQEKSGESTISAENDFKTIGETADTAKPRQQDRSDDTHAELSQDAKKRPSAPSKPEPLDGINYVNDAQIVAYAEAQMNRLIKADEALTCTVLNSQATDKPVNLALIEPTTKPRSPINLYRQANKSVVAILISRKHLDHWHAVLAATGFFISDDGVIATNRHVFDQSDEYMFAMTSDYVVHPIQEVLTANTTLDIACFRIASNDYRGIALKKNIPVGAPISLISNPAGRFFFYTQGMVARHYIRRPSRRPTKPNQNLSNETTPAKVPTRWLTITAAFGKGSSGGPVFDRFGNIVGMATSTNSLRVGEKDKQVAQMNFRDCVPADVMLDFLQRDTGTH